MSLHLWSCEPAERRPEGLEGLAEYEGFIRAANAPTVLIIDKTHMLRLLDYVHRLENELRREGGFW